METEHAKAFFAADRFAALAGIEIIESGPGRCTARMVIGDKHLNAAGVVQGGAIFTLADLAFAVASNSHGQLALAINVNISFLAALSSGTLLATATEVCDPNRIGAYDVLVTDQQDRVVARFNGLVYRKQQKLKTLGS
ncbi:PaaI family thioesterase [Desulfofustis glycolicus]|uniref:Acyl-CoA thioesterase n=1 Tax=Desulfofustis glycolicus DSM 9705 TaxID=1121409 RepID=A0A1M5V567_9BACT|nr:PaaI family thioesterase [Desulfofustis glycolicus]MCB2214990.1 PaaI family thioesterase [Desulfobulbaceae bacterium]SHH70316.1 acyl-CoA thioesterase [Desulfofustis glycolicus DSM 9705]